MNAPSADIVIADTRRWLDKAVIGLELCPFAKAVYAKEQIRYAVSEADVIDDLLDDLEAELRLLSDAEPASIETTLLIHPRMLPVFADYNDFLGLADGVLQALGFAGRLQIASFHPHYQFAGATPGDISNFTNRSPHPMLHLLRESSVDAAVAAFPEAGDIYLKNIETMRRLGRAGWDALHLTPDHDGKA